MHKGLAKSVGPDPPSMSNVEYQGDPLHELIPGHPAQFIYLIRCFGVLHFCIVLRVVLHFDELVGRVKIQTRNKHVQRY